MNQVKKSSQSTLEYLLIITIIIVAIIIGVTTFIGPAVEHMLNRTANSINTAADNLP
jgi:Flp pilus assembly pilin Flp